MTEITESGTCKGANESATFHVIFKPTAGFLNKDTNFRLLGRFLHLPVHEVDVKRLATSSFPKWQGRDAHRWVRFRDCWACSRVGGVRNRAGLSARAASSAVPCGDRNWKKANRNDNSPPSAAALLPAEEKRVLLPATKFLPTTRQPSPTRPSRHVLGLTRRIIQNGLFDSEKFGWWHTELAPEAFRRLSNGMEGLFRASILKLMPAAEVGEAFDPQIGRPTKELHAMCGLLLLGEYRNWSVEQTANAWCFDASVQFALNLPRDKQNISERTVDNYRQLLRESEAAQDIFETVTGEIIREMGIAIKKQRLDSTHIFSDMARFGRLKLLAVTTKRFLTQLKRHDEQGYQGVPEELRERYCASETRV